VDLVDTMESVRPPRHRRAGRPMGSGGAHTQIWPVPASAAFASTTADAAV
jgi:hypothetical protein